MKGSRTFVSDVLVLLLSICVTADSNSNNTEKVQRIDMINISAFVTDYADGDFIENVSKVFYEEIDGKLPLENMKLQIEDFLARNYFITSLIKNQDTEQEFAVDEVHSDNDQLSRISIENPNDNIRRDCMFHSSGVGHTVYGIRCRSSKSLPEECFCWDGVCTQPYLTFQNILKKLLDHKEELEELYEGFYSWNIVDTSGFQINSTFKFVNNQILLPVEIFIEDIGHFQGSRNETVRLKYSIIQFEPSNQFSLRNQIQSDGPNAFDLQPFPGIFCPVSSIHPPRSFPKIPNQFSVEIETVYKNTKQVSYVNHQYDLHHRLVSFRFLTNASSTSLFLSPLARTSYPSGQVIHDFNSGLQYMLFLNGLETAPYSRYHWITVM